METTLRSRAIHEAVEQCAALVGAGDHRKAVPMLADLRRALAKQAKGDDDSAHAAAHVAGRGDRLVKAGGPLGAEVADWRAFLVAEDDEDMLRRLRRQGRTGRPLGSPGFVTDLEQRLSRPLSHRKPGPQPGKRR